ncbi:MAG: adenylate/guanylate cyclase domain-containing protein [Betaproteobacteria bacterium]|nr:adenylate/guanylate cyclase domain-containing protein [Betaproteobacteria bacterium]
MTEEVMNEQGFLDKYIGDGIMAFWGAPVDQEDQADRAVRTAQAMIRRLQNLQEQWRAAGFPIIDIGIGINLGVATVGNMGSSERFDYTAIGDTVNAASRLEQLTREYANHIIISESTKNQLTIQAKLKDLGEVKVKGKEKSIRVYEVLPN